jgi:hypothetical protein
MADGEKNGRPWDSEELDKAPSAATEANRRIKLFMP